MEVQWQLAWWPLTNGRFGSQRWRAALGADPLAARMASMQSTAISRQLSGTYM
jgi:hypothetical protein